MGVFGNPAVRRYRRSMPQTPPPRVSLHLRAGWTGLLVFVVLGVVLEALHAVKAPAYLDVGQETRRLMWTLAHAHGTLLSLVHLATAATEMWLGAGVVSTWASRLLLLALVLLPVGFFLGGIGAYGGDPGLGVFLAPVGALAMVGGVALVARGVWQRT